MNETAHLSDMEGQIDRANLTTAFLRTYVSPIMLLQGIFVCIPSALVLYHMTRNLLPSCLYLFVAMPIDLAVLSISCTNDWLSYAFGIPIKDKIMNSSPTMCKFLPFLSGSLYQLSVWMTVAAVVELGSIYTRPYRIFKICTLDRARAVILLLVVIIICLNTHCFWSFDLVDVDTPLFNIHHPGMECKPSFRGGTSEIFSRTFILYTLPLINIITVDLIPLCTLLSFVVIVTVRWNNLTEIMLMEKSESTHSVSQACARTARKKHFKLRVRSSQDFHYIRQLHKVFVILGIVHLILLLPSCVSNIFVFIADENQLGKINQSELLDAKMRLGKAACAVPMYLFLASKGLILFVTSELSRKQLSSLMHCKQCHSYLGSQSLDRTRHVIVGSGPLGDARKAVGSGKTMSKASPFKLQQQQPQQRYKTQQQQQRQQEQRWYGDGEEQHYPIPSHYKETGDSECNSLGRSSMERLLQNNEVSSSRNNELFKLHNYSGARNFNESPAMRLKTSPMVNREFTITSV